MYSLTLDGRVIQVCDNDTSVDSLRQFIDKRLSDLRKTPPEYVSCDTETMGHRWLEFDREAALAVTDVRREALLKERDLWAKKGEAFRPETNHLGCVQFVFPEGESVLFVTDTEEKRKHVADFFTELKGLNPVWLFHNAKFDGHQIQHHLSTSLCKQLLHDTFICETVLQGGVEKPNALKDLCERYEIPDALKKVETDSAVSNWWDGLTEKQILYAMRDVFALPYIYRQQRALMQEQRLFRIRKIENELTPRLVNIERRGVHFNCDKLQTFLLAAKEVLKNNEEVFRGTFKDTNFASPKQMVPMVEKLFGVTPVNRKYDNKLGTFVDTPSVDKFALLRAGIRNEPAIAAYIALREVSKAVTEAEAWLRKGEMRVTFHQVPSHYGGGGDGKSGGTVTGRLSTSPQMQNIPNFMKQFVEAPSGPDNRVLCGGDYGQIELRLFAQLSMDPVLLEAFAQNRKLHHEMCELAFGTPWQEVDKKSPQYRISKEINFGFIYGMGGPTFCTRVLRATDGEIQLTDEEGWAFREMFFRRYPNAKYYHQRQAAFGALYGYVETLKGRRRYYDPKRRPKLEEQYKSFWDPSRGGWVSAKENPDACWRAADWRWRNICYNHPDQGSAADAMKIAMINLEDRYSAELPEAHLFGTVHDSAEIETPFAVLEQACKIQNEVMREAFADIMPDVPCVIEHTAGKCWASEPPDILNDFYGLWVLPGVKTVTGEDGRKKYASEASQARAEAYITENLQQPLTV